MTRVDDRDPHGIRTSQLAHDLRDRLRTAHAACEPEHCPLSRIWAEDVQEILDAADGDRWERAYDAVNQTLNSNAEGFVWPPGLSQLSDRARHDALSIGWKAMWAAFKAAGLNPPRIPRASR